MTLPALPPPPPHRRRGGTLVLLGLVAIAVIATLVYLLSIPARRELARFRAPSLHGSPSASPLASASTAPGQDPRLAALGTELAALRSRVEALERRAPPAPPSPALPAQAAPAIPLAGTDPIVTALATRLDALAARQDRMDAQLITQDAAQKADAARLEASAHQAEAVAGLTQRTARLARLQAAAAALAAGQALGPLADAPPALLRFQAEPPPTEAGLRLGFPAAARAARAAARPVTSGLPLWQALRARAAGLITIRRNDTVLIGSQQIAIIDRARTSLEAGDLAGAVTLLGTLTDGSAAAIAPWRDQAVALLAARAALAGLVRNS